jgi:hypothetical protein
MTQDYTNSDSDSNSNSNSDSDSDDYDYNSDSDDYEAQDMFYEPEEISNSKFNIVLCENYNGLIHGNNNSEVINHYLIICRFKKLNIKTINSISRCYNTNNNSIIQEITPHQIIKNYKYIVSRINNIKPEIAECYLLQSGHSVCIIKTIWIKLIQRTWRKIYNIRKDIIQKRCMSVSLKYREINGRWPNNCIYLPTLIGMLSK